ncbi:translation initiation factor IF-2-like [Dipodomys spectabilis]|uniref:translation initiation factor IF-2-like n=1 Tax=Dipodomys spectabilis TaxID=105255 RepID=UPI001C54A38C|nr:translation initiation factor IF-2-like [Dipodomys spectabilis]
MRPSEPSEKTLFLPRKEIEPRNRDALGAGISRRVCHHSLRPTRRSAAIHLPPAPASCGPGADPGRGDGPPQLPAGGSANPGYSQPGTWQTPGLTERLHPRHPNPGASLHPSPAPEAAGLTPCPCGRDGAAFGERGRGARAAAGPGARRRGRGGRAGPAPTRTKGTASLPPRSHESPAGAGLRLLGHQNRHPQPF